MCFDRNINGNRDIKFLIWINGHCTAQMKETYFKCTYLENLSFFVVYLCKIMSLKKGYGYETILNHKITYFDIISSCKISFKFDVVVPGCNISRDIRTQ